MACELYLIIKIKHGIPNTPPCVYIRFAGQVIKTDNRSSDLIMS